MSEIKVPSALTTEPILPNQPVLDWDGTYLAGDTSNVYFA